MKVLRNQEQKELKQPKVCAGIVTYNPDIEQFRECFNSLKEQVDFIYIVDNASENRTAIDAVRTVNTNIQFNNENFGIATALNQLCKKAHDDGYQWILTMDQDSICRDGMVKKLVAYTECVSDAADNVDTVSVCNRGINQAQEKMPIGTITRLQDTARERYVTKECSANVPRYGIIAPRVEFWKDGILITSTKKLAKTPEKIRACITSGSLTNLEAWKDIGGFDDWMFIDHVDNEFCTHLWKEGYEVVRVHEAVLYQRAGEMKFKRIFGKNILLPHYSEKRNYYICRNTVYFLRKYRHDINFMHDLCVLIYCQAIKIFFENHRLSTITSTYAGIRDGLIAAIH